MASTTNRRSARARSPRSRSVALSPAEARLRVQVAADADALVAYLARHSSDWLETGRGRGASGPAFPRLDR